MPKIFSEKERVDIISSLQKSAMKELSRVGVRKTTVDELCRLSHLAKGSFYLFYESKEELFLDFKINSCDDIFKQIEDYIYYFNYERPQVALNYLTPIQFKQFYYNKKEIKNQLIFKLFYSFILIIK